ncbi:MAG TPA: dienelactone hydrolase family protein [Rhodanobacteraceae bacterium]
MGKRITVKLPDGHALGAYLAEPGGKPRAGIIVVQEIFGITPHIRAVTDRFARLGYTALAPAFFDYVAPDTELAYNRGGTSRGRGLAAKVGMERATAATAAAAQALATSGKVGVVGFCWGGTVALLAAQQLGLPAVSYYGARNTGYFEQPLKAPVIFHFGDSDPSIPADAIQRHRVAWPDAPVYVYPRCGHAFNRDADKNAYNAAAAKLAWERTTVFFARELAG